MYKKLFYILFSILIFSSCIKKKVQQEEDRVIAVEASDEEYEEQGTYPDEYSESDESGEDEYYDVQDVNYNRVPVSEYLSDSLNIVTNDSLVQRNFKSNLNEKYTGDEFDYTKTKPKKSLWSKFKEDLAEFLSGIFSETDAKTINGITLNFLRVLAGIIIALSIYYFVKLLSNKKGGIFFSKKDKNLEIYDSDIIEDINEIDFNKIIAQYELERNYNSAFRYQFLAVLKNLTDCGKIKWTQEKTNIDYLNELKDTELKKQFKRAVFIFNHIWYGDFKIGKEEYSKYVEEIKPLKNNTYE